IYRIASTGPTNSGPAYRIGEDQVSASLQRDISTRLTSEWGQKRSYNHVGSKVRFVQKRTSVTVPKVQSRDRSRSPNGSYGISVRIAGSLRLDAGRLDHLGPFLGFVGNELAKIGGRARERRAAEVGEPCFHVRVCEGRVDLFVEFLDDLGRRGL